MGHLRLSSQGLNIDTKTVILTGDLDLAGLHIHDGMISTSMAKFEFVGLSAQS